MVTRPARAPYKYCNWYYYYYVHSTCVRYVVSSGVSYLHATEVRHVHSTGVRYVVSSGVRYVHATEVRHVLSTGER